VLPKFPLQTFCALLNIAAIILLPSFPLSLFHSMTITKIFSQLTSILHTTYLSWASINACPFLLSLRRAPHLFSVDHSLERLQSNWTTTTPRSRFTKMRPQILPLYLHTPRLTLVLPTPNLLLSIVILSTPALFLSVIIISPQITLRTTPTAFYLSSPHLGSTTNLVALLLIRIASILTQLAKQLFPVKMHMLMFAPRADLMLSIHALKWASVLLMILISLMTLVASLLSVNGTPMIRKSVTSWKCTSKTNFPL
jgi:hypothetical protein